LVNGYGYRFGGGLGGVPTMNGKGFNFHFESSKGADLMPWRQSR
jgi:hypothetical protein